MDLDEKLCEYSSIVKLYQAARDGNIEIIKLTLNNNNNNNNNQIMCFAAQGGHIEIVKLMLDKDVINYEIQNFSKENIKKLLEFVKKTNFYILRKIRLLGLTELIDYKILSYLKNSTG